MASDVSRLLRPRQGKKQIPEVQELLDSIILPQVSEAPDVSAAPDVATPPSTEATSRPTAEEVQNMFPSYAESEADGGEVMVVDDSDDCAIIDLRCNCSMCTTPIPDPKRGAQRRQSKPASSSAPKLRLRKKSKVPAVKQCKAKQTKAASSAIRTPVHMVTRHRADKKNKACCYILQPKVGNNHKKRYVVGQSALNPKYKQNIEALVDLINGGEVKTVKAAQAWLRTKSNSR